MLMTMGQIVAAVQPETISNLDVDTQVYGVSTDSRTTKPGEVFVAIRGEHFDGNSFVNEAMARGAVAAIVDRETEPGKSSAVLRVPDGVKALQESLRPGEGSSVFMS